MYNMCLNMYLYTYINICIYISKYWSLLVIINLLSFYQFLVKLQIRPELVRTDWTFVFFSRPSQFPWLFLPTLPLQLLFLFLLFFHCAHLDLNLTSCPGFFLLETYMQQEQHWGLQSNLHSGNGIEIWDYVHQVLEHMFMYKADHTVLDHIEM